VSHTHVLMCSAPKAIRFLSCAVSRTLLSLLQCHPFTKEPKARRRWSSGAAQALVCLGDGMYNSTVNQARKPRS
jgi:hypothetical protein